MFFAFLAFISPYAAKQMETSYNNFMKDCYNYVINCQKEEESSEEILEESSKEEEIVYEPSPEEIALSLPQDDYALYIPDIYCKMKVHICDNDYEIRNSQYWVDLKNCGTDVRWRLAYGDSVEEAYDDIPFICDHCNQGFSYLHCIEKGAKAYIAKGSEIEKYECTDVFLAHLDYVKYEHCYSQVLLDQKTSKNLLKDSGADLILMTCTNSGGRYIVYFKKI